MFKKLKEKIAEEVKPLKIPQFAQSVVSPGNNALVESPPNELFTLDDEVPDVLGNEGFSVVDLHHPSQPLPLSSGRFSRQSSMSSLASDASAFLPIHDASLGAFNMQDMESASEREDILPQLNSVSKQELCNSYLKLYRHYQKYKGRTADLKSFCSELEKDNKKLKTVLLEGQEKSLRRMAELKEQCALEQDAKAHLEEALRNDLEEKDHLIQTLQTKIKLLKEAHSASSSLTHTEDKNLYQLPGEISEIVLSAKSNFQPPQVQQTEVDREINPSWRNRCDESEIKAFKERIDFFKQQIFTDSNVDIKDAFLKTQLNDFLNYILTSLEQETIPLSQVLSHEQEKKEESGIHNYLLDPKDEVRCQDIPEMSGKTQCDLTETTGNMSNDSVTNLQSAQLGYQDSIDPLEQIIPKDLADSVKMTRDSVCQTQDIWETCSCQNRDTKNNIAELENELQIKNVNFEKVTQELEVSQQVISSQDSVISDLQNKLSSLQSEIKEAFSQKEGIAKTVDALKCELVQTKLNLEEFQQQCLAMQCAIEEKDQITKESKENLVQVNQELDKACAAKSEMNKLIINMETELAEIKDTCQQLTQEINSTRGIIQEKESTIKDMEKDFSQTLKDINLAHSQKDEANEIVASLKDELEETKHKFEQMSNKYECVSKSTDEKDLFITNTKIELNALHRDLETVTTKKVEACEKVICLQTELNNMKLHFEEITSKLQSAQELVKEKDLQIIRINDELTLSHQQLETASKGKTETDELVAALENELTSAKSRIEQLVQDFQSAQKMVDLENSNILNIKEELVNVRMELDMALSQNIEGKDRMQTLQNKLLDAKLQIEELTENLQSASKLIAEKDCDILNVQKELDVLSLCTIDKSKVVADLQHDLKEARLCFTEICKELQSTQELVNEKDVAIALINKDLAAALKDLEATSLKETEAVNLAETVKNELMNVNIRVQQKVEELHSAQQLLQGKDMIHTKLSEEMSVICKEVDKIGLEKTEALETVSALQSELLDVNAHFRDITAEFQSAHKIIEDKDSNIACLIAEIASLRNIADSSSVEKQEINEKVTSLENELTNTKHKIEQLTQELQSSEHATKEKESVISYLTEELTNMHKDLDVANSQNTNICATLKDIQNELKEVQLKYEFMIKELEVAHHQIEEKNSNIVHLSEDLTRAHEELNSISALKSETYEAVTTLQRELQESRTFCDKVTEELETARKLLEEKNRLEQFKEEPVIVKDELDIASTEKSRANENVNLQCKLKETMFHLEEDTEELQSAHQVLEDKKLVNEDVSDSHTNSSLIHCDEALVLSLQNEIMDNKLQLEKLVQEIQQAHNIIKEKDSAIKEMREELTDIYKKLNTSFHKSDTNNVSSTSDTKFSENSLHQLSPKHFPVSSPSISQVDCPNTIFRNKGQLCDSGHEEMCKSVRNECSGDHSEESVSYRTVNSDISANQSSSDNGTVACKESSVVKSDMNPVFDKVANISEHGLDSEEHPCFVEMRSSEWYEEGNSILQSNKKCEEDSDFLSQSLPELKMQGEASNIYVPEPLLTLGHDGKNQINPLQFPGIQNILEEIQKENIEYGLLLQCHKNIINHLEQITKVHDEGIQPGSAEWLHKQLVLLSQKLYDTKEKQRIQIASINKFVKHQEDLKKTGVNENNLAIEMQYLRNIVFQYMIGKETMLLAKVISAVMKFDQQQMDQVMQKELQKQTLLGQLGLL